MDNYFFSLDVLRAEKALVESSLLRTKELIKQGLGDYDMLRLYKSRMQNLEFCISVLEDVKEIQDEMD